MFGYQGFRGGAQTMGGYGDFPDPQAGSLQQSPYGPSDAFSGTMLGRRGERGQYGISFPQFMEGGTYGASKWNNSPYEVDIFAPRGSPIKAPFSGTVSVRAIPGP